MLAGLLVCMQREWTSNLSSIIEEPAHAFFFFGDQQSATMIEPIWWKARQTCLAQNVEVPAIAKTNQ